MRIDDGLPGKILSSEKKKRRGFHAALTMKQEATEEMMEQEKGMAGLTDMVIWSFLQPGSHHEPNIPALKEAVNDLCQMTMQKTAGQRRGKDLSWDNLERVKFTIICEATALVLSGKLDQIFDE